MNDKKKRLGTDPFDFIGTSKTNKNSKKSGKIQKGNGETPNRAEEIEKYKHTDIQTKEGKISEVGERATFYIKPDILTEVKIISIRTKKKNLSELVNEALEDLIKKYKKNLTS